MGTLAPQITPFRKVLPRRFPLDNAAQIFVNILSPGETTLSRISLIMTETVDRQRLQQAVNAVIGQRFPYFQVYLKKTFFAYVLEHTDTIPQVEDDSRYSNRYVDFHRDQFLFRFRTNGQNIALEMSHILTDGHGMLVLLLSVAAEYLRLGGVAVEASSLIRRPGEAIDSAEWECAYASVFSPDDTPLSKGQAAYIPTGEAIPFERYYTTLLCMDLGTVRRLAWAHRVPVALFMSGIYLWAIQALYLEDLVAGRTRAHKPLRLQIPIDLRRKHPCPSLKNFSYVYSPSFSLSVPEEGRNIEQIIRLIVADIRQERHSQAVEHQICRNLRIAGKPWYQYLPCDLKERLLAILYRLYAREFYSGVLTSMGDIQLPPALQRRVQALDMLPCNSPAPGRNTVLFSYRGELVMNIGSTIDDLRLENKIGEKMGQMGIAYTVTYHREPPTDRC